MKKKNFTQNCMMLALFLMLSGISVNGATPQNVALDKPTETTAAVYPGYEPSYLVDGDDSKNSVWSSDAIFPQSIVIDLKGKYVIDSSELVCFRGNVHEYTISVSNDNSNFIQVIDRTANTTRGTAESPVKDKFNAVVARYIKLTLTGGYVDVYFGLNEFRVFGVENTSAVKSISDAGLSVYLNPVSKRLTIAGGEGKAGIEVYSLQGTKIYKTSQDVFFPHQVDLSAYKPGIYFVKVMKDGKYFAQKIVKSNY